MGEWAAPGDTLPNEAVPPQHVVVDNMVLAMFVDAGQTALLPALAGRSVHLSPSILDPNEGPPYLNEPVAEFARGIHRLQGLASTSAVHDRRLAARTRFFLDQPGLWTPEPPTPGELEYARYLTSKEARALAKARNPQLRLGRADPGEAECAAIAVSRSGWRLWSDDSGIVPLVRTLHPECTVERTCALVARAVNEGLLTFAQGHELYEHTFKVELGLHTSVSLGWQDGQALCR